MSALRHLPPQPTPLLRFLACEAAFATENTPEVRLPPPHIAVEHTDACQLDIRCAARAAGHRSTCDVVGQEGLCDTIIGKPVHSFQSSSDDARPTYSSWMVAAMMAATPIQLPVTCARHHISPLCAHVGVHSGFSPRARSSHRDAACSTCCSVVDLAPSSFSRHVGGGVTAQSQSQSDACGSNTSHTRPTFVHLLCLCLLCLKSFPRLGHL